MTSSRKRLFTILIFLIGIVFGQYSMIIAIDPVHILRQTLVLSIRSYIQGCVEVKSKDAIDCHGRGDFYGAEVNHILFETGKFNPKGAK